MTGLFSAENWFTLLMLILLQAVLGFDNLLYVSLESKKVAPESRAFVRRVGLGLAIVLRVILLFVILQAISLFQEPLVTLRMTGIIEASLNLHAIIVLVGGGVHFIHRHSGNFSSDFDQRCGS